MLDCHAWKLQYVSETASTVVFSNPISFHIPHVIALMFDQEKKDTARRG